MKKTLLFSAIFLTLSYVLKAQDPYTWTFSVKKTGQGEYELHSVADVKAPWHTYSQLTPAGGPVPTRFTFTKNPLCQLIGKPAEQGKMITRHEDVFGVDVKYFEGTVDFVQKIKLKGKAKTHLSGSVQFMVCNDQQCLPPATQTFNVTLE